jgi:hypothetical protein
MWRKIHSSRDPRDTLYSELVKEFKPRFAGFKIVLLTLLKGYPNFIFGLMVLLMLASVGLSFTVFRNREKVTAGTAKKAPDPVSDGFSQIMATSGRLRETLWLKHTVDSLASVKQLSPHDSLTLENALDRLRKIHLTQK